MKGIEKIWMLNYELVGASRKELDRVVMSLPYYPRELKCEAVEKVIMYCDNMSSCAKESLKGLIIDLYHCNQCYICCKKSFFIQALEMLNAYTGILCHAERCPDEEKVGVVVPNFLSANSFLQPPIDMLNIISILKKEKISYEFIDNRVQALNVSEIGNRLKYCKYLLVTTTPYDHMQNYFVDYRLKSTFLLVNYLKWRFPNKYIILCGAHGTVRPDLVENECKCDFIVCGEYDFAAVDFINALINKRKYQGNNIYYCNQKNNSQLDKIKPEQARNINIIPAYEEVNLKNYYGDIYENNVLRKSPYYATILGSRGCYNNCSYCYNFWGNDVRYRDEISIVDEMEVLEYAGAKGFFFIDSTFTQNKEWVYKICKEIRRRGLGIKWSAETRTDCVDAELLEEMKKANCMALWFGVESYCDRILNNVKKNNDCMASIKTLNLCRKVDIKPQQFIMIGAPGETIDSLNETLSFLINNDVTITESVMVTTPRFGTKLYDLAKLQFPNLGGDFYSLNGVKGLVGNELSPEIIYRVKKMSQNRHIQLI